MSDPIEVVPSIISVDTAPAAVEKTEDVPAVDSAAQSSADPVAQTVAASVDAHIGFDPAIHAVNPDGTPRMKVGGGYALKRGKGGRKSQAKNDAGETDLFSDPVSAAVSGTEEAGPMPAPTAGAPVGVPVSSRDAAIMIVMTCTAVLSKTVGPEWQADKAETKNLTDATKAYLDSKGGLSVTPEMALFLAVTGYAVPRFAHENTQTRAQKAWQWVTDRVAVFKARFGK